MWVGLAVLLALPRSAVGTVRTCLEAPTWKFEVVAGITKIPFPDGPGMPYMKKAVCVTDRPSIEVTLNNITFNLLNATVSDAACRRMYRQFLCTDLRSPLPRQCYQAHQIVFAILESVAACRKDSECRATYTVPPMLCSWKRRLQEEVCSGQRHNVSDCGDDDSENLSVANFCFLNNPICEFVVVNVVAMSISTGVLWALTSIAVIYYGQHLCNRVERIENQAYEFIPQFPGQTPQFPGDAHTPYDAHLQGHTPDARMKVEATSYFHARM